MARTFDQDITYKVNIDDSNFQAKLTQMRASLDSTVGGSGNFARTMAFMGPMGNFGGGGLNLQGGFADFGASVQPVTFTPPAIAMQPHFGMFQVQQSLSQAGLSSAFGPAGIAANQIRTFGLSGGRDFVPPNMSYSEYINYSTKALGDRAAAMAGAGMGTVASLGTELAAGAIGTGVAKLMGMGMFGSAFLSGGLASVAVAPVTEVMDRAATNMGMQSALSAGSFRFYQGANVDPITGRGFDRATRNNIATSIMRMEANDNRFNTTDYRQVLEGGMQMDLFSGTRDAEDFKTKFKSLVDTVKTVSSTLHTSLKEGLETIRGLRDMGITDPTMQQSMVLRAETYGRASGRTGMEMMQIGQTGAEMFRGTGISMQRGFELNQQNATLVRSMLTSGDISRNTVAQAGGELAFAQQLTANALGSFQTTLGRGFMMAAFDPRSMSLDPNMVNKLTTGDTISGMANAASVMSNPGNMIRFQAHQEEMISKMSPMQMQLFSASQTASLANTMMRSGLAGNASFEDTYMAMGLREGKKKEVLEGELGLLKMNPEKLKENMNTQIQGMSAQAVMERDREGLYGYKRFTNILTKKFFQPYSEAISNRFTNFGRAVEDYATDVRQFVTGGVDQRTVNASNVKSAQHAAQEGVNAAVRDARSRGITDEGALRKIAAEEYDKQTGSGELEDLTDPFGSLISGLLGGEKGVVGRLQDQITGKEQISKDKGKPTTFRTKEGIEVYVFGDREEAQAYSRNNPNLKLQVVKTDSKTRHVYAISAQGVAKNLEDARNLRGTDEEISEAQKKYGNLSDKDKLAIGMAGGDLSAVLKAAFGKKYSIDDLKNKKIKGAEYEKFRTYALQMGLGKDLEELGVESSKDAQDIVQRHGEQNSKAATDAKESMVSEAKDLFEEHWYSKKSDITEQLQGNKAGGVADALSAYKRYLKGGDKRDLVSAKNTLMGAMGIDAKRADEILNTIEKASKSEDKNKRDLANKFLSDADLVNKKVNQTAGTQATMSGSDAAAASGLAAALGRKELEAFDQVVQSTLQNIQILVSWQEKLNMARKQGGGN